MHHQRNALKAGLFIVVSGALIVAVVLAIRGIDSFVGLAPSRQVLFPLNTDISGLRVGDDVRVGGLKVGEVLSIKTAHDPRRPATRLSTVPAAPPEPVILVTISFPPHYTLREDAELLIQTNFTGQAHLNFPALGQGKPLDPKAILEGKAGGFSAVVTSLQGIAPKIDGILAQVNDVTVPRVNDALMDVRKQTIPKVNDTVDSFRKTADTSTTLVEKVKGHVDPVAAKVHQVGDSTSGMMTEVRDLIGDTKTDFRGTMANLNAATASFRAQLPGILDKVDSAMAKIDKAMNDATEAMQDIKLVAENSREMTGEARDLIVANRGKIDTMLASLRDTSRNLEAATAEMRRSPWRLLYRPGKGESANLNVYDAARQFADGASEFSDAAQALRDAAKTKDVSAQEIKVLLKAVEDKQQKFNNELQKLEEEFWKRAKE